MVLSGSDGNRDNFIESINYVVGDDNGLLCRYLFRSYLSLIASFIGVNILFSFFPAWYVLPFIYLSVPFTIQNICLIPNGEGHILRTIMFLSWWSSFCDLRFFRSWYRGFRNLCFFSCFNIYRSCLQYCYWCCSHCCDWWKLCLKLFVMWLMPLVSLKS